jgi:hypothetical protein
VLLLAVASLGSTPGPTAVPSDLARARVDELLRSGHADPAWFATSFFAQVPATQVDAVVAQLKASLGAYQGVDGSQGTYTVRFTKGTVVAIVHLDDQNKIDGLLFKEPKLRAASLEDALEALQPAGGALSYVIVEGRSEIAARDPSAIMAVGSAFKLAVLAALRDQISRGRSRWSDVAPLRAQWKSLPSGVLSRWPDATPLTLATLAAEMISISDNTAADALVRLVGPSALALYALRNDPFLTTREAFILKSTSGSAQRAAFLAAQTAAQRSAVLRAVDGMPLPALQTLETKPDLAVEWHYNVRELCALMQRVADLPLMSINPGVADAASFRHVAFKGGSDTGVINLTTQVTTKRGTALCFSATLNDPSKAVDERSFETGYALALSVLANR